MKTLIFIAAFVLLVGCSIWNEAHADTCIVSNGQKICGPEADSSQPLVQPVLQPNAPVAPPVAQQVPIGGMQCAQVLTHHTRLIGDDYDSWDLICPGMYGYGGYYGYPYPPPVIGFRFRFGGGWHRR